MAQDPNFWRQLAAQDARRAGINPDIFLRQINQESGFNPKAESGAGAVGIAQIVPRYHPGVDPRDPYASLKYAANYMATLIHKYGSYEKALSVYNSGQPDKYLDPHFSGGQTYNYVKNIMSGQHGQDPSVAVPSPSSTTVPALRDSTRNILPVNQDTSKQRGLQLLRGLLEDKPITSLVQGLRTPMPRMAPLPVTKSINKLPVTEQPLPKVLSKIPLGVPVSNLTSKGAEHETAGLAGYPAYDYFAPPGSAAVAPVTGKVIKLSGHDPSLGPIQGPHGPLGWSVYIQGVDGHTYYMTHMGSRQVKLGQTVKAGTPIGTVANYDRYGIPSHIHMGVR
jgi:murein DD-endopeptidase MepM/ murein hydrolase activator NlpD